MINLLTNKQKKTVHQIRILRIWIAIISGTISLICVVLILFFPTYLVIQERYTEVREQEKQMELLFSITPEALTELSKNVTDTTKLFVAPEAPSSLSYLRVVQEKQSPGIRISKIASVTREKKTLEVGGLASTRTALQQYEALLRADERVEKVESPVSNYVKTQDTVFVLTILFK